ncbi:hypothetical protein V8F20_000794 [Naviculisporaceae sp. PSN 640]
MGGYANSADGDHGTFIDPQTRLGGDGGPYTLSTTQIVVIIVVITVCILALTVAIYYRKLQARRKYDLERNQVIELRGESKLGHQRDRGGSSSSSGTNFGIGTGVGTGTGTGAGTPFVGSRPTTPGKTMPIPEHGHEQEDPFRTPDAHAHVQGISLPEPAVIAEGKAIGGGGAGSYADHQRKPPLWKYVHWKDGPPPRKNRAILPQVEPGRGSV